MPAVEIDARRLLCLFTLVVLTVFMYREVGVAVKNVEPLTPLHDVKPLRVLELRVVGSEGVERRVFSAGEVIVVKALVEVSYVKFRGCVILRCTLYDSNGEVRDVRYTATKVFQGSRLSLKVQVPVPLDAQAGEWLLKLEVVYENVVEEFEEKVEVA